MATIPTNDLDNVQTSISEEECEEVNVEGGASTATANFSRGGKTSGEQSATKSKDPNGSIPYCVYVPPKYFKKEVSSSKSTTYKCLMGCQNKTVTVFNKTLNNARRHVKLFHKALLDEFNPSFSAGRQSANVCGKQLLLAKIDNHLVNLNNPSSTKPIASQTQLDDQIMDYIIQDALPLREVEKEGFVKLMTGLVGTLQLKKKVSSQKN